MAPTGSWHYCLGMGNSHSPVLTGLTEQWFLIDEQQATRAAPEGATTSPCSQKGNNHPPPRCGPAEVQATSCFQPQGKSFPGAFPSYPALLVLFPIPVPPHRVCCIVFKYNQAWASQVSVDLMSPLSGNAKKRVTIPPPAVSTASLNANPHSLPPPGREQQKVIPPTQGKERRFPI